MSKERMWKCGNNTVVIFFSTRSRKWMNEFISGYWKLFMLCFILSFFHICFFFYLMLLSSLIFLFILILYCGFIFLLILMSLSLSFSFCLYVTLCHSSLCLSSTICTGRHVSDVTVRKELFCFEPEILWEKYTGSQYVLFKAWPYLRVKSYGNALNNVFVCVWTHFISCLSCPPLPVDIFQAPLDSVSFLFPTEMETGQSVAVTCFSRSGAISINCNLKLRSSPWRILPEGGFHAISCFLQTVEGFWKVRDLFSQFVMPLSDRNKTCQDERFHFFFYYNENFGKTKWNLFLILWFLLRRSDELCVEHCKFQHNGDALMSVTCFWLWS